MRVILVRHGQTAWNLEQRAQGQADIPLDETGLAQATHVGEAFSEYQNGGHSFRLLSSDLKRAYQTAQAVSETLELPIEIDLHLRERHFGDWEGRPYAEIAADFAAAASLHETGDRNHVRPPNGESLADVWDRLDGVVERLIEQNQDTILVSHGGTLSLLLAKMLGGGLGLSNGFKFYNAAINEVASHWNGNFRLVRYNDINHLTSVAAIAGSIDGSSR